MVYRYALTIFVCLFVLLVTFPYIILFYSFRFDLVSKFIIWLKSALNFTHTREKHVQFQPIRIFLYGTLELFHFLYFTNCSVFAYHFYRHSFVKLRILFKHIFDSAIRNCRNIFLLSLFTHLKVAISIAFFAISFCHSNQIY